MTDASGRPIRNARVTVAMKRHAFGWGTSLTPSYDLLPPRSQEPLVKKALPILFGTFNHVAVDIDLKLPGWINASESQKQRVIEGLKILRTFNRFVKIGLPTSITEFDAKFAEFADPRDEADFVRDFTLAAFSHPAVQDFTMWGFSDAMHWLGHAPLYDKDLNLKPSGRAWRNLVFKEWWTNAIGNTNAQGKYLTRGFVGDYQVTASARGITKTVPLSLLKAGRRLSLALK